MGKIIELYPEKKRFLAEDLKEEARHYMDDQKKPFTVSEAMRLGEVLTLALDITMQAVDYREIEKTPIGMTMRSVAALTVRWENFLDYWQEDEEEVN